MLPLRRLRRSPGVGQEVATKSAAQLPASRFLQALGTPSSLNDAEAVKQVDAVSHGEWSQNMDDKNHRVENL